MELFINIYITAFLLGAVHAIEVDHMVAVSVFAGMKPKLSSAARYGCKWGLGHAIAVVLVGGLIAWLGIKIPEGIVSSGEILVGVALIALGLWAIKTSQKFHTHTPEEHDPSHYKDKLSENIDGHSHGHLHAHVTDDHEKHCHTHKESSLNHHQHLPAAMGALHGLAGSAPVLALIPITMLDDFKHAIFYLLSFSIGTTLSMMLYAVLAALAIQKVSNKKSNDLLNVKIITHCISAVTIVVGLWWIANAAFL
ncbi:MAG: sulfite exporter TauE/SafE family protein [Cellvibrionaceae bacterium]